MLLVAALVAAGAVAFVAVALGGIAPPEPADVPDDPPLLPHPSACRMSASSAEHPDRIPANGSAKQQVYKDGEPLCVPRENPTEGPDIILRQDPRGDQSRKRHRGGGAASVGLAELALNPPGKVSVEDLSV